MRLIMIIISVFIVSATAPALSAAPPATPIDSLARAYVGLALRVGQYVPDYIDAYFGPDDLKQDAAKEEVGKGFPYQQLCRDVDRLLARAEEIGKNAPTEAGKRRLAFLLGQLSSMRSVLDRRSGKKLTFDEEAEAIYEVKAPQHDSAYYDALLQRLDSLLPGQGDVAERYAKFQESFIVPRKMIDTLVRLCLSECRRRTAEHLALPDGEKCRVELVGGQSWGGYNWYLGGLQSLIQIDTTTNMYIGSLIGSAAHEGYPGHHYSNIVKDKRLVQDSGWIEYSVFPLFSPSSVIDEGMANFGVELVFPLKDRAEFYKRTLFPLAGLDTSAVETYCRVLDAKKQLDDAALDAARMYLDGIRDSNQTIAWLRRYALETHDQAVKTLVFFSDYRSYRVTYTVGEKLVSDYVNRNGDTPDNPARRWELFDSLLTTPCLPIDLE